MRKVIMITEEPLFKYSKALLPVCTIIEFGVHYVAFGNTALEIYQDVCVRDKIEVTGYMKSFTYRNGEGLECSRNDFIIKEWKLVERY